MSIQALESLAPARQNKPKSLFQFLTWAGGLKPDPDLRASLDGKFGWMVRKSGMSLDDARIACIEEGFLIDSEEREEPSINDLLDLIAAEAAGHKQYRIHEAVDAAEWEAARGRQSPGHVAPAPKTARSIGKPGPTGAQCMTPSEFDKLRIKLDLGMYDLARALGKAPKTCYRYANGEEEIPETIAKLLRMYAKFGIPKDF